MGKKARREPESESESERGDDSVDEDEREMERAALRELMHTTQPSINNKSGLLQKLEEMHKPTTFLETLALESAHPAQDLITDAQDDLQRELKFYEIAIAAAKQGEEKLVQMSQPFWRPTDYYCEMAKDDQHMMKVKGRLIEEQKNIAAAEERRKLRESKKFGKQRQAQAQQEKAQAKKKAAASADKFRDDVKKRGVGRDDDDDDGGPVRSEAGKRKREAKDMKYGSGARVKKAAKRNTSQSSNSMRSFSARKNMQLPKGFKKVSSKGKPTRPNGKRAGRKNKR